MGTILNIPSKVKFFKTNPVHQGDKLVSLKFSSPVDDTNYKVHFDEADGTGLIADISLKTAIIPTDLLGSNFNGDIHAHLVYSPIAQSVETITDILIPVIPKQNAEAPR